jgi:hypothetical protein
MPRVPLRCARAVELRREEFLYELKAVLGRQTILGILPRSPSHS